MDVVPTPPVTAFPAQQRAAVENGFLVLNRGPNMTVAIYAPAQWLAVRLNGEAKPNNAGPYTANAEPS